MWKLVNWYFHMVTKFSQEEKLFAVSGVKAGEVQGVLTVMGMSLHHDHSLHHL